MKKNKPEVSIIYVLYKQLNDLVQSIESVMSSDTKVDYEVVVVDNEGNETNRKVLKKKFPEVRYIRNKNTGYGAGNNLGVEKSSGEYIFILNPDTLVKRGAIDELVNFLNKNKKASVISPNLLTANGELFDRMGSSELTPLKAIFTLSILNKIFPDNNFEKDYYLTDIPKDKLRQVSATPGSAFMIKRSVFNKMGGFDENFFMFFEEQDIGKRMKELNYEMYITPKAEVVHKWKSSKKSKKLKKIFKQSRSYYFKKHFGFIKGGITEFMLRLDKYDLMFMLLFLLITFIKLYDALIVNTLSGEIADNLLDIKNYWTNREIPLRGPPTSHNWLDFGPLFYWIYGPFLVLSGFDPQSYFVFGAFISILTVLANYIFVKKLSNSRIAFLSSILIAFSPFYMGWGQTGRFFTIVLLLIYPYLYLIKKYLNNKKYSLFFPGILMGIMLNFHFTPLLLIPPTLFLFFFYKRTDFIKDSVKYLLGILITNIPLLIYDASHGFIMISKFVLWIPYRVAGFMGLYPTNNVNTFVIQDNIHSFYEFVIRSFVIENVYLGLLFFVIFIFAVYKLVAKKFKTNKKADIWIISLLFLVFGYLGIFIHGSPPEHYYMPIAFIPALYVAKFIVDLDRKYKFIFLTLIFVTVLINIYNHTYLFGYKNNEYEEKMKVVLTILEDANGQNYAISRMGENDQFEADFAQDYQFLLWWKGNEPVKVGEEVISESLSTVEYIIVEDDSKHDGKLLLESDNIRVYRN